MDEEKKYSVVGQVTIGTDEYRELIEEKFLAEKERDDYRSKYWHEMDEKKQLQEKVAVQEKALEQYRAFVNKTPEIMSAYKMYLVEKSNAETDEILQ